MVKMVPSLFSVLIIPEASYQEDLQNGEFADLVKFKKAIVIAPYMEQKYQPSKDQSRAFLIHSHIVKDSVVSGGSLHVLFRI